MKRTRTTLMTAIAIGLLAGSAVGVAAQDEAADPKALAYVTGTVAPESVGSEGTTTYADGFLGIDGESDVEFPCKAGESHQAWHQFRHNTLALAKSVTRVQGGQLHRNLR